MSNYTKTTDFEAKDSLPTGDAEKIIRGADFETEFDNIATAIATKADTAGPTFTGTLTFGTISDGTIAVTAFVDEDDMVSNSATLVPTQQSVKAYVDSQTTAQDLDFQADSGGALSIDLDSEALTLTGGTGIDTSGALNEVTFAIDSTVATLTGTQTLTNKTLTAPTVSGNLTTDGNIDGRDVATDGTKLDGIESGATADQTAAEIRTLVDSATDSNVFTDADHTKLDGIEASATADQTDAEIRAAIEAATDSNVFTDADHTKLDGIEASADVTDTANVTAAGALMDSEVTNLAQVKAFDSADYATAAQGSTADSALQNVVEDTTPQLGGDLASNGNDILFADNDKATFGAGSDLQIYHDGSHSYIKDGGIGDLRVIAENFEVRNPNNNKVGIKAVPAAQVELYYDNTARLATTSTGIDVTGTVTADSATIDGAVTVNGAGINLDDAYSLTWGDGSAQVRGSGSSEAIDLRTASTTRLNIDADGDLSLYNSAGTSQDLFWDSSTSRLGLGTTSPSTTLELVASGAFSAANGNTTFTGVGLHISPSGTTPADGLQYGAITWGEPNPSFGNYQHAAIAPVQDTSDSNQVGLSFLVHSSATRSANLDEAMRIDSSGNVGIGTDSPANLMHLEGSQVAVGATQLTLEGSYNGYGAGLEFVSRTSSGGTRATMAKITADGEAAWNTTASTQDAGLRFSTTENGTLSEAMRITSAGRVGIGEASPAVDLHITNSGSTQLLLESGTDSLGYLLFGDPADSNVGSVSYDHSNNSMRFETNDSECLRIDSSGNLLVGTTGIPNGTSIYGAALSPSTNGRTILYQASSATSGNTLQAFYNPNGQVGSISTSGSATAFNTSSDQRLKDNIVDAPSASDDIDAIQVRSFYWKADGSHQKYGMVAQELQGVAPEAVSEGTTEEDMMGVDYSKLVPMLVKEIQSLRARVAQLEGAN